MAIPRNYLENVYAGLLGKCIGIRIGAPVEPTIWTYERIRKTYGEITSYVKDYRNFAADDDFNGPVFFLRALVDHGRKNTGDITAADIGKAWLNYTREEKGFYWWGGYGRSTEHTAWLNLAAGLPAPVSGSIATNGAAVAEQIGGQIFVDTWGLVIPGDFRRAADYGGMAASVSHDGNGMYGGRFIAAAISRAFDTPDVADIVECALSTIPRDSEYARVVRAVRDFHAAHPLEWRDCMEFLISEFGYDRYPGVCHIIPNAGVCILSLLYGNGNLSRTVEIATMCGWDTDCNAGNVGCIVGVAGGLEGVEDKYRLPMNDFFACSSVAGSLNIVDLPSFAGQLAALGSRLDAENTAPSGSKSDGSSSAGLSPVLGLHELRFDFALPGSTHGFRTSSNLLLLKHARLPEGGGALEVLVDRLPRDESPAVFFKPFYRREDFDDERYSPAFTPLVYPGQTLRFTVRLEKWNGNRIAVVPYVRETWGKKVLTGGTVELEPGTSREVEFTIPDSDGAALDEVGFRVEVLHGPNYLGKLFVNNFSVTGKRKYSIDFAKQAAEFATITPGTTNRGFWELENGSLAAMSVGRAEFYTGNYYTRDVRFSTTVTPRSGVGHGVLFRAKGAAMWYGAAFMEPGRVALLKNEYGVTVLGEKPFAWKPGTACRFEVEAVGARLRVMLDGEVVFDCTDTSFEYGMFGFLRTAQGRCLFGNLTVEELPENL